MLSKRKEKFIQARMLNKNGTVHYQIPRDLNRNHLWASGEVKSYSVCGSRSVVRVDRGEDEQPCIYTFGGPYEKRSSMLVKCEVEKGSAQILSVADRPPPRTAESIVFFEGYIIVFGGLNFHNDVWRYHIETNTWEEVVTRGLRPTQAVGHSADILQHKMVVFGCGVQTYVLDLHTFRWDVMIDGNFHPSPAVRFNHCSCVFENRVWIFGGANGFGPRQDMWSVSLRDRGWTEEVWTGEKMESRQRHVAAIANRCWVIHGGIGLERTPLMDTFSFDFAHRRMDRLDLFGCPLPRMSPAYAIAVPGRAGYDRVLFGGYGKFGVLETVELTFADLFREVFEDCMNREETEEELIVGLPALLHRHQGVAWQVYTFL